MNKLNMSFKKNKLQIGNKPYSKRVVAPKYEDLLRMTMDKRMEVQKAKLVVVKERREKGNACLGYVADITKLE